MPNHVGLLNSLLSIRLWRVSEIVRGFLRIYCKGYAFRPECRSVTRIIFLLALFFSFFLGQAQAVRNTNYDPNKPFSCPQCQRRYKRKDNLQAHLRYECGQEPQYSCPICQHKFLHRRYIQKHMMKRHPTEYEELPTKAPSESVWY